jgi:hypothetical protein
VPTPGEAIRLADWIGARVPAPPAALSQRLAEIVRDDTCDGSESLPDSLISRAEELLAQIGNDRSSATDLLAADALITYAMEAAAEYSLDVDSVAERAAVRLSAVLSRGEQ